MKAKPSAPKMLAPCECRTVSQFQQIQPECRLTDELAIDVVVGTVRIRTDRTIVLLRSEFEACIRWWQKKQKVKK